MKAIVFLLFSLFSSSVYSNTFSFGELLESFESINRTEEELICTPDGSSAAPQAAGPEQPSYTNMLSQLSHNGKRFVCKDKVIEGCSFTQCTAPVGMLKSYPKPMAILIPKGMSEPSSMRVHFHGWSHFGKKYDKSLDSMIDSMEFGRSTCKKNKEITLIPYSAKNKNTHHHTYLASTKKFNAFIEEFQMMTSDPRNLPIKLSGHSGGGKVASKIVSYIEHDTESDSATARVKKVDIYDGLYSSSWVQNYKTWFQKSKGVELNIHSIKSTATNGYSKSLFNLFGENAQTKKKVNPQSNKEYFLRANQWGENKIVLIEEKYRGGDHHWEMNRDFWGF